MIFELCRATGVPIWHIDVLRDYIGIVYIGIIGDETNEAAPNRGPQVDAQTLG